MAVGREELRGEESRPIVPTMEQHGRHVTVNDASDPAASGVGFTRATGSAGAVSDQYL